MIASTPQTDFDPYHNWLGVPSAEQPAHAYRLLGLELFESDPDVIEASAEARLRYVARFLQGNRAEAAQRLLTELMAARDVLLIPRAKQRYDQAIAGSIAAAAGPRAPRWRGEPGVRPPSLPLARPAPPRRQAVPRQRFAAAGADCLPAPRFRWRAITRRIVTCTAAAGAAFAFTAILLGMLWMIELGDPPQYAPPVYREQSPTAGAELENFSRG